MSVINEYESPIYASDSRNSQRRSLRVEPLRQRRERAWETQQNSGFRIRISRPVMTDQPKIFERELKAWIPFVHAGVASRRSIGNFAVTMFDTNQQPLMYNDGYRSVEELREKIAVKLPKLLSRTGIIKIAGIAEFGSPKRPFIGLTFKEDDIKQEIRSLVAVVAPELALDDNHQQLHIPHISLGQVHCPESVAEIKNALEGTLPDYVRLAGAEITYE